MRSHAKRGTDGQSGRRVHKEFGLVRPCFWTHGGSGACVARGNSAVVGEIHPEGQSYSWLQVNL
jgi:hypothetical protein